MCYLLFLPQIPTIVCYSFIQSYFVIVSSWNWYHQFDEWVLLIQYNKQSYNKKQSQVKMKVQLKTVLKSTFSKLRCMEQNQIVYQTGNNLCIQEIGKHEGEFVHLNKQNNHLYDFIVAPNCKSIFTAEKHNDCIEICSYNLENERKSMRITDSSNYLPFNIIQSIELQPDQYQSSVVFVITKGRSQACITLVDMLRSKIISHGFVSEFNHATVCSEQTYEIAICGKNFARRLKAVDGGWTVQERLPKKLQNQQILINKHLPGAKHLLVTRSNIYITQDSQIAQSLNVSNQDDPIKQIVKLNNRFIVVTEKLKLKLFGEEGDEGLYFELQKLNLDFGKAAIKQVQYNPKSEQLIIVFKNGKFFHTRVQDVGSANKENYFHFEEIQSNHSPPVSGTITTTTGQSYCLISTQKKLQLWDLSRLCLMIALEVSNLGEQKIIRTSAINPDGHSICVGYSDRVRFYRILLNKFRQFGEYLLKNTSLIHYSHGGQLIAFIYGKGLNSCLSIVNTLSLKQVLNFKLGFKPAQVVWNEHDDQIFVSGDDTKIISVYQISTKSKKHSLHFDHPIAFIRFDYLTRKLLASTQNQVYLIDSDQNTTIVKPKIDNFDYIFPFEGVYLGTDRRGGLYYSNSIQFEKHYHLSMFENEKFSLLYRKGVLIAYTSPANVFILKFKLNNDQAKPELAENIILVQKEEVNKFFDKVKLLEGQFDQLQTATTIKLDEQRKKYNDSLEQNQRIFKQETAFLQKKLAETTAEKSRQQKTNARVFDELQTGQIKSVNQLEKVYDMKLKLQKQKYLNLEQESLEQKIKYEKMIKNLEQKYHKDIEKVRSQYTDRLNNEIKSIQNQKQRHLEFKKKAQTKLIDLEQEGQVALYEVQMSKDSKIANLLERNVKLQRDFDAKVIALHNMEEEMGELNDKYKETQQRIKKNEKIVQQNLNRVQILEKEIQKKNKIIEQKNSCIEQQAHQIDNLEKAKYVLSFRTTQVRKQLEPKESLIEKLKSELFKLDQQYKGQTKKSFELKQRLEKTQKLNSNCKKQNNDLKAQLKTKERVHNDLCSEIFFIVNNTDPKQWNSAFVKIYQNYIQEEKMKLKSQKKDDSTSEQINRHLIHVEQSLHQVSSGNEKMLKGKQKQVMRKMKQNAQLVYDLNIMRKKQNQYMNQIKQKNTEISRLKRQIQESSQGHKSTRANTANTATRRVISRDPQNQNNNSDWIDLSLRRQSDYLLPDKNKKSRVLSANRTMVWREEGRKQKSRISDLARELQSAKNTIMRQDRMIEELNQRLLGLPQQNL